MKTIEDTLYEWIKTLFNKLEVSNPNIKDKINFSLEVNIKTKIKDTDIVEWITGIKHNWKYNYWVKYWKDSMLFIMKK